MLSSYCRFRILAFLLLSILTVSNSISALAQTPIGVESIDARYDAAALSPDGRHLALSIPQEEGDVVNVIDLENPTAPPVAYPFEDAWVLDIVWGSPGTLLVSAFGRYTVSPYAFPLVYIAHPSTREPPIIIQYRGEVTTSGLPRLGPLWSGTSDVVDFLAGQEPYFYLANIVARRPGGLGTFIGGSATIGVRDVLRVDSTTGIATSEFRGAEDTAQWIMDGEGHVLARIQVSAVGNQTIQVPTATGFRELTSIAGNFIDGGQILGLHHDGTSLLVRTHGDGGNEIYPISLTTGERSEPIFSGPEYAGIRIDPVSRRVVGFMHTQGLLVKATYFVPELAAAQAGLETALANHSIAILGWSSDFKKILFEAYTPSRPPVLAFYDLDGSTISTIAERLPAFAQASLPPVQSLSYNDPNGMALSAHLILPPDAEHRDLPLAVVDDTLSGFAYDQLGVFLTMRGYAVLRPGVREPRSLGELSEMGELTRWVSDYHDSVLSALELLGSEGTIDRERVCIVGTGEHGYITLMTAANYPEAFKCAVGVDGVYDLVDAVYNARPGYSVTAYCPSSEHLAQTRA